MRRSWPTGPLHFDNQSIFKERFHLDKADPNILHDEITVIDHALTRPWSHGCSLMICRLLALDRKSADLSMTAILLKNHTLFQIDERSKFQTKKGLIFGLV